MGNEYQPRREPPSGPSRIQSRTRPLHERLGQRALTVPLGEPAAYREPEPCPYLPPDREQTTARVPTPQEVERLKKAWLRNPTWDIEWACGFECIREELANWHRDQILHRCQVLQCSPLMGAIIEELVHCWIDCKPPTSPLAQRILLSFG